MPMSGIVYEEYWLVFKVAEHWIHNFLKKDFSHVYVVTKDQFNWIRLNPLNEQLEVRLMPYNKSHDIGRQIYNESGHRVIKIRTKIDPDKKNSLKLFHILSCVSITKYITGIRMRCFTPYQLFKKLRKMKKLERYGKGVDYINYIL